MPLPPLCNLFAVHDCDPARLEKAARALQAHGEFQEVWRPAPGWVAAADPLPHGEPDGPEVRNHGLAFAEGRDVVSEGHKDLAIRFAEVAKLADEHPDRLPQLQGDFTFIRLRPNGHATAVRSCGGLVPIYLQQNDKWTAVATRLGDLVRYLPETFSLDPLANAVWLDSLAGIFPDNRTFLKSVSILPRGSFALLKPAKTSTASYWDPRPIRMSWPTPAVIQEHRTRLRNILLHRLERDLDPREGNLLTLSGGVDSSSLAALAGGVLGRKIMTFSLLPAPEDMLRHERHYIDILDQKFGFERRWEVLVTGEENQMIEMLQGRPDALFRVLHPALWNLPRICRETDVRVLFGGELADEVCGSVTTWPDWKAAVSFSELIHCYARGTTLNGLRAFPAWLKQRVKRFLGRSSLNIAGGQLPEYIQPNVREEYREWVDRKQQEFNEDLRPKAALAFRADMDGWVPMNWEATSACRVRRSLPFFNRESLELAFECHPVELVGPGLKKLLRGALLNDVPAENLGRQDKGFWGRKLPWNPAQLGKYVPPPLEPILQPNMENGVRSPHDSLTQRITELIMISDRLCKWDNWVI